MALEVTAEFTCDICGKHGGTRSTNSTVQWLRGWSPIVGPSGWKGVYCSPQCRDAALRRFARLEQDAANGGKLT